MLIAEKVTYAEQTKCHPSASSLRRRMGPALEHVICILAHRRDQGFGIYFMRYFCFGQACHQAYEWILHQFQYDEGAPQDST